VGVGGRLGLEVAGQVEEAADLLGCEVANREEIVRGHGRLSGWYELESVEQNTRMEGAERGNAV
jgi:hypothetical protein